MIYIIFVHNHLQNFTIFPEFPLLFNITDHINAVNIHYRSMWTHTHTHPFNSPFSGIPRVGRYQKGKTNLDFTEARDSEWQWHQLGHKQVYTSLQTDNHASTSTLSFLQAGCPSCRPTNSIKALKAVQINVKQKINSAESQKCMYIHISTSMYTSAHPHHKCILHDDRLKNCSI